MRNETVPADETNGRKSHICGQWPQLLFISEALSPQTSYNPVIGAYRTLHPKKPTFQPQSHCGLNVRKNRYPMDQACLLGPFQYRDRNL